MEAARVLAERGHQVSLYEKADRLGGQWDIATQEPSKERYGLFTEYLTSALKRFGARVVTGREVTQELVREVNPDVIILATGAEPQVPDIPGIKGENVVLAGDVITGQASLGATVAVVGARLMGIEIAEILVDRGKSVSLIDQYEIGQDVLVGRMVPMLRRVEQAGTKLYPHSPVVEIKADGVVVSRDGKTEFIPADTVVLATGMKPVGGLAAKLKGIAAELYTIGDCAEPRRGMDAVYEGVRIATRV